MSGGCLKGGKFKHKEVEKLEREIDELVYELYELDADDWRGNREVFEEVLSWGLVDIIDMGEVCWVPKLKKKYVRFTNATLSVF